MNDDKPNYPYVPLPRERRDMTKEEQDKFLAREGEFFEALREWFWKEVKPKAPR